MMYCSAGGVQSGRALLSCFVTLFIWSGTNAAMGLSLGGGTGLALVPAAQVSSFVGGMMKLHCQCGIRLNLLGVRGRRGVGARRRKELEVAMQEIRSSKEAQQALGQSLNERAKMLQEELMNRAGTWADADPAMLDTGLRTDDGFLAGDIRSTERNFVKDLLTTFGSKISQRISGRLSATVVWASYVTAVVQFGDNVAPDVVGPYTNFVVPNWPHELVGGFLAILIVFRTNQAYERFWEGRKLWAHLTTSCRSLSLLALENFPKRIGLDMMAHVAAFPTALKMHLRGYKNERELGIIFHTFLGPNNNYASVICSSNNMPLTIVMGMSQLCAPMRVNERSARLEAIWELAEDELNTLTEIVSECEKIKCTPIPLSYSRHTSRFFSLFTFSLPFVLVKQTSPLIVPIAVLLVSWVLFSTEEIGRVIEEPFGNYRTKNPARVTAFLTPSMDELERAFKAIDSKGKGYVDQEDVSRELPKLLKSDTVTEEEVRAIVSGLDLDRDGVVQFEEFYIAWSMVVGSVRTQQLEALPLNRYCDNVMREALYYWGVAKKKAADTDTWAADKNQSTAEERTPCKDADVSRGPSESVLFTTVVSGSGYGSQKHTAKPFELLDANCIAARSSKGEAGPWRTDASAWLAANSFVEFAEAFDAQNIDMNTMLSMGEKELATIGVTSLGKRKMLLAKIQALKEEESKRR